MENQGYVCVGRGGEKQELYSGYVNGVSQHHADNAGAVERIK